MAQRPAPKKSNFGASHPIEHVEATVQGAPAPVATVEVAPAATHETAVQEPKKKPGPAPQGKVKTKAALFADEAIIERIRGAWHHTPTMSGERETSFSDFLLEAALVRAREREERYNSGKEFPHVKAGTIGAGRKS